MEFATKLDYQQAVQKAIHKRSVALQAITDLTLGDEFSDEQILGHAHAANAAILEVRRLKSEMRKLFPIPCTCNCSNHGQEN